MSVLADRDIRAAGAGREELYRQARGAGVLLMQRTHMRPA